jgi:hypothetical protein
MGTAAGNGPAAVEEMSDAALQLELAELPGD